MYTTKQKIGWSLATVIVSLIISAFIFAPKAIESVVGAVTAPWTTLTALQLQQGLRIPGGVGVTTANTGTTIQAVFDGTCNIVANTSAAATSTTNYDCAFSGVQSGDKIFASLTASTTLASQYVIKSAQASTTSGFITFSLLNLTGIAAVPASTSGFGSSTQVMIIR